MAILSDPERVRVWRAWMRRNLEACGFTKVAVRNAVNATDQWQEDNTAAYLAALPAGAGTFKATATNAQIRMLFLYVALDRAGLLGGEGD